MFGRDEFLPVFPEPGFLRHETIRNGMNNSIRYFLTEEKVLGIKFIAEKILNRKSLQYKYISVAKFVP
jgi:hypothetical protein